MPSNPGLAVEALSGFADGASYDAYRPTYPDEAVSKLLSALNLSGKQGARVLDLAAGTGKFTELLAARPEKFEIIAVEPHDGMRAELERKKLPNVVVKKGLATNIPLDSGDVDAVIAAQVSWPLGNMLIRFQSPFLRTIFRLLHATPGRTRRSPQCPTADCLQVRLQQCFMLYAIAGKKHEDRSLVRVLVWYTSILRILKPRLIVRLQPYVMAIPTLEMNPLG
jgi:SAM-dependent methyltransferase